MKSHSQSSVYTTLVMIATVGDGLRYLYFVEQLGLVAKGSIAGKEVGYAANYSSWL
ncbi:hypothetical protein P175DRAFT_0502672 [Aspergillus ochraceoroseus IBT 24754]|uniref:Uncharacterized protein n=1 Tax=Aspergillus ochraceoroseus IBT 24754 TaxID=1392256 RepID=A0A2T5LS94_9EURO|nr:uncharacterized protein P175DRAFT_0502672 [Aspergillus ochraceoroseus IBT 24754]PTU19157.1 hypothetical protein P175DRAFT_0502672 [Aspergillus ochraceoroseus IBT 24754]